MEKILKDIEEMIEKPFVTATFGDNWRQHAKENYDLDSVIDIAWKQGRRSVLLERKLAELKNKWDERQKILDGYFKDTKDINKKYDTPNDQSDFCESCGSRNCIC